MDSQLFLEFVRPHGWLSLVAILASNALLFYRYGERTLLFTIPMVSLMHAGLDIWWIREEIAKPDWRGAPDQDAVFYIGMLLRVSASAMLMLFSCKLLYVFTQIVASRNRTRSGG